MEHIVSKLKRKIAVPWLVIVSAVCLGPRAARSEPLSSRILALYPKEAGELVFVDLRQARRSPYFTQVQGQLLPPSFQKLERVAADLGVDFGRNVDRLSWAYLDKNGNAAHSALTGVVEGAFDPDAAADAALAHKLNTTRYGAIRMFSTGVAENGHDIVLAFTETADCVFGSRGDVQAMLDRASQGGANLLDNETMRQLVDEVNQDAPIWMVLNGDFTQLGIRQLLADAIRMPGVDTLSTRIQTATVRMDLERGLATKVQARCATSADAMWFSTLLQGALAVERQLQATKNPTMSRVISASQVQRDDNKVILNLSVPESDLAALVQSNGLVLHF